MSHARIQLLAAVLATGAACGPIGTAAEYRAPTPAAWAGRYPVLGACASLVEMRRATPLADGDSMPQPQYMDVGDSGTPGVSGQARFVVTERGLVDPATISVESSPPLTDEPRRKLVEALGEWRLVPAREDGCNVAAWFSYQWANE